ATGVISLRTTLVPLVLGLVSTTTQVGLFRIAQAPQTGLTAASSPARLVLLTEQTRDWEGGREVSVLAGIRKYTVGGGALMVVAGLGARWGVTGAAVAVLVSTIVFAAAWAVAIARLRVTMGADPTRLAGGTAP